MPIGTCRHCLTPNVELRDSQFIPAGFTKQCGRSTGDFIPASGLSIRSLSSDPQVAARSLTSKRDSFASKFVCNLTLCIVHVSVSRKQWCGMRP